MAGVESLVIRGVRSFGPDDSDEQRIKFDKPLTLILGQNGCGKTTIIECLRYAITGQMPPGSRNECFVHDAKVNRSTEVLGQVKLKIVNARDKQLEVSRSMKVTSLQKKKTKFQTLDSFLSVIDETGKTKDVSSRCADLDFVMHEELGVSKAILNSVIFCHQEDSSWPLDEGKKVKERFDEIFDADKYSDCFDRLKKIRKEYMQTLKLLEQEVAHLTEKKQEQDKKKLDVVNTETRISEAEIKVAETTQELKPISEKLNAIKVLENNLLTYESKREKIKVKLEHCQAQEQELKKGIKNLFEGSLEELEKTISNYEATDKLKKKELDESYKKNYSFNKEEEKIANEKTANESKISRWKLLESQNEEKIDQRNKMLVKTAKLAEIEDITVVTTNEDVDKAITTIANKIKSLKKDLSDHKSLTDAEEKKLQLLVDEKRDALTRQKEKVSNKESEIQKNKREIIKLEREIASATESKQKLEVFEKKLAAAEEEYQDAVNELNIEEFQQEINDDEKALEKHEQEREELSEKITKLQKQSSKLKERDMIDDMLKQKEKQFSVLKNKHKTSMAEILGTVPEKDFAISVNTYECEIRTEVESLKKQIKQKQIEVSALEAERRHERAALTARRGDLARGEDRLYQACGAQPYGAALAKCAAAADRLQEEQNVLKSSMTLFAKYNVQLKDNSCCPLCNRGFDNENEVADLISHLTTQVLNVPAKLEKVTEELQRATAKKEELISMKSLNESITTLKEKDIPQLEERLADLDAKIQSISESSEELSMSLVEPEQKMQTAKKIQGEMPLLDRCLQEINTINKKLESVQAECKGLDSDMSLDDAIAKQNDLKQKISTLKMRIKAAQKKLNAHNKQLQSMAEMKNKIKEDLLNIQKKVQEIVNLQETMKQLESDCKKFVVELAELQESKAPLELELKEKETAKNETVKKNRETIDTKNNYIVQVVSAFDKIKAIQSEIKQHKDRNISLEMDKIKAANDKLMDKQKQIMSDRQVLTKRIDSLKDELAKQDIYKRDLEDNLKLRKTQSDIEKCEKENAEINEKLSGVNRDMLTEKEPLISQQTKIFREKAQTEGMLEELKDRLKQLKTELKKAQNKDIDNKYREKYYELHVTKVIDKDIKDYSVALEKCLMEFHREKMENINLIIRELWRKIYRGNDIDHIEIKTEGSMTVDSERRKYDYRVVQCKNGIEIDMRGRCSAGQKVLACLIIRLALAETFSSRFGILALDEPTTNLDQENIRSLCSALVEIVKERMTQKNFMFIIITHDREFIESLGSIDKVSHFYEVSRNKDGKSRIKKIKFT